MDIKKLHPGFKEPEYGTDDAGAFDIFMPEPGVAYENRPVKVGLGFSATVPYGYVGLILPRSGVGTKNGLELMNTAGVIDHDYTGEWMATLHLKQQEELHWKAGDRLLQCLIVPVKRVQFNLVDELKPTGRGSGGHGSTGQ